jgi:Na+-driven multidrug efflux pump
LFGLVLASATLVGHNLGAGKPQQAEKTALKASYMGALTMVVVAVVYFVFSEWLVSFFSDTEEVIKVGSSAFRMISPFMVFAGLYYPLNGAFFGSGDTKPPMVITFLSTFCFQIHVMIIASQVMGENGVFLGFGSAFLVGFCIMIVWFFRGTWKQKKLE